MPRVTFTLPDGAIRDVEGEEGLTVMHAALEARIPGIDADCYGHCACATCHVYVEPEWKDKAGPRNPMEEDMLDFAFDVRESSRLSCQIKVSTALDGLRVKVPEKQF